MSWCPVDTELFSPEIYVRYIFKPKCSDIKEETTLKFILNVATWEGMGQ